MLCMPWRVDHWPLVLERTEPHQMAQTPCYKTLSRYWGGMLLCRSTSTTALPQTHSSPVCLGLFSLLISVPLSPVYNYL